MTKEEVGEEETSEIISDDDYGRADLNRRLKPLKEKL